MALNKDSERRVISDFVDGPEAAERKARVLNKNRTGKELRFCKKKDWNSTYHEACPAPRGRRSHKE